MNKKIYISMACLLAFSPALYADNAIELGEVTVTATQDPTLKASEAPLSVDVVTSDEMQEKGVTTTKGIFEQTSGVDAKSAGGSVMPVIRGLSDGQVLILIDGVRLSDERPGGNHILSVDPAQIEKVEFVKGPGSVLYGAGAIGGVVNLITKKGNKKNQKSDEMQVSGNVGAGYGSNNAEKRVKGQINLSTGNLNLYAGGTKRKSDNYKSPKEEVKFSFYDGYTVWGGGDYTMGDWNVALNVWQNKADIGIASPRKFVSDYFKGETHTMGDIKATYSSDAGLLRNFSLTAGYQEHNRHRIRQPNETKLVDLKVDKETKTLRGQWVLAPNDMHRVTTGFDYLGDKLTSARAMKGFPPVIAKFDGVPVIAPSTQDGVGLFLQDAIKIDDSWSMNAGVRYDYIKTKTDGEDAPFFITTPQSDTDSALSGNMGAVYSFGKQSNIYANIGRAFRTPTLIERYFFGPHDGPAQDKGNPYLDPETSLNTDIGVRIATDDYKFSASVYYNKVDNLIRKILINPAAPVPQQVHQYQNIAKAVIYGGELDFNYFINDTWSLFGSASYTKGKNDGDGTPLNAIPANKVRYGLDYDTYYNNMDINLELSATSAAKQDRIGIGEKETPGYTTVDFKANLIHSNGISAFFAVENIFDKTYYDNLSYGWQQLDYAQMGRNVKFELNYKF